MDLALNNLQWLMCHKTQPNQTVCMYVSMYVCMYRIRLVSKLLKYFGECSPKDFRIICDVRVKEICCMFGSVIGINYVN